LLAVCVGKVHDEEPAAPKQAPNKNRETSWVEAEREYFSLTMGFIHHPEGVLRLSHREA